MVGPTDGTSARFSILARGGRASRHKVSRNLYKGNCQVDSFAPTTQDRDTYAQVPHAFANGKWVSQEG